MKFDAKKHLKPHRIKKEKTKLTLEFVMEGNEASNWLEKEGTDLDVGVMAMQNAATIHCQVEKLA